MKRILPALLAIVLTLMPSMLYAVQPDEIMADPARGERATCRANCAAWFVRTVDRRFRRPLARSTPSRARADRGGQYRSAGDGFPCRALWQFVLKPPVESRTLLLWLVPPLVLLGGGLALWSAIAVATARRLGKRVRHSTHPEEARLEKLIAGGIRGKAGLTGISGQFQHFSCVRRLPMR